MVENWKYAEERLLQVSRTFALNINVLKGDLHRVILLAYLYLRIADTVEDDAQMKAPEKVELLKKFAAIFESENLDKARIEKFRNALPKSWEVSTNMSEELSFNAHKVISLLLEFDENYQKPVREVVSQMCGGMAKFVLRQEEALSSGWFTLEALSDLDEYCYYVAGIVGKLLTQLFTANSKCFSPAKKAKMESLDVSFGLALQLVNIIKDCVEDSKRKVCFIPEEICRKYGFQHSYELFENANENRGRVLKELIDKAWKHLEDAINYTLQIPRCNRRVRLFCLWPLFMAAENLRLIGNGNSVFESEKKVKISRKCVKKIIAQTMIFGFSNAWIQRKFNQIRN